ncbi:hypothetical protein Nepgr_022654 [Nepenthes gracilis]|uniref:Uncharacterized protein n=1 Tax=Nepenthes gracilis TaxID=150966 RepID=A0AAD3T1B9_NEPGR|nr:hypothetical protein Nepgr_022654 [Nepenthes gracilis]
MPKPAVELQPKLTFEPSAGIREPVVEPLIELISEPIIDPPVIEPSVELLELIFELLTAPKELAGGEPNESEDSMMELLEQCA